MPKKQFVLLQATRDLENYISRERYNLTKMSENQNVSDSLLTTKVTHFNGLVATLNHLFSTLMETNVDLFEYFGDDGVVEEAHDYSYSEPVQPVPEKVYTDTGSDDNLEQTYVTNNGGTSYVTGEQVEQEPVESLEDTESEESEAQDVEPDEEFDDGVQDEISMKHADEMLSDYERTSEQDIASYDPELDSPTEVLSHVISDDEDETNDESMLSEENLRYLNHTADDVRVNDDPIQIADTITAVEKDQEVKITGTDTHIKDLLGSEVVFDVDKLVDDDFNSMYVNRDNDSEEYDEAESETSEEQELESEQEQEEEVLDDEDDEPLDETHDDGEIEFIGSVHDEGFDDTHEDDPDELDGNEHHDEHDEQEHDTYDEKHEDDNHDE